jgi:hypothetical protein
MSSTQRNRSGFGTIVGATVLVIALAGAIWMVQQPGISNGSGASTVQDNGYPAAEAFASEQYLPELGPTDLPAEMICANAVQGRLELEEGSAKRETLDEEYERCMQGRQNMPTPAPTPIHTSTPFPTVEALNYADRPAGDGELIESGAVTGLSDRANVIVNGWIVRTEAGEIWVLAGGLLETLDATEADRHGYVLVREFDSSGQGIKEGGGYYVLPEVRGKLRIVAANGAILTLVGTDGTVATFDPFTRELVVAADQRTPTREVGGGVVVESGDSPYGIPGYMFTNHWYREADGVRTTVLAGTNAEDVQQSIVAVVTASVDNPDDALSIDVYETSVPVARLLVMDVTGDQILLAAPAGRLIAFDLSTREFDLFPEGE